MLYDLRWPSAVDVGYVALWAFGLLVVGMVVFRRFQGRLVEEL